MNAVDVWLVVYLAPGHLHSPGLLHPGAIWQNHMLVITQPVMGQPQPTWPKSWHQPVKGQILVTLSYTCTSCNINSVCLSWNYVTVIRLWYIIATMFVKYGSNTIQSRYFIAFSRQMLRGGNPHARPWWWDISQFAWWYDIHMLMFSYYIWSCDSIMACIFDPGVQ